MRIIEPGVKQDRYIKVLEIINALNASHRQGLDGYYDCGELGIARIYWSKQRWNWDWIEISEEFLAESNKLPP